MQSNSTRWSLAVWQFVVLGVLLSLAGGTLAQTFDVSEFDPGAGDLSVMMLKAAVGDWTASSTSMSAIGAGMRIFNTGVLALAVAMFMYYAIVGTVNTAQDGRVLGQKWSTTWIPLRFVIGISLLVPTASGFSAAQYGILAVASWGVGGATKVASAALPYLIGASSGKAVVESSEYRENLDAAVRSILGAEACLEYNRSIARAMMGEAGTSSIGRYTVTDPSVIGDAGGVSGTGTFRELKAWGSKSQVHETAGIGPYECGVLSSQIVDISHGKKSRPLVLRTFGAENGTVQAGSTVVDVTTQPSLSMEGLARAQIGGVEAIAEAVEGVAKRVGYQPIKTSVDQPPVGLDQVGATREEINAAVAKGVAAYRARTDGAIAAAWDRATGVDALLESIESRGWVMLGSIFYSLGETRSKVSQASYWVPTVQKFSTLDKEGSQSVQPDLETTGAVLVPGAVDGGVAPLDATSRFTKWLATTLGGDPNDPNHALVQIKDTGDKLMVAAETAYAAGALGGAVLDKSAAGKGLKTTPLGAGAAAMFGALSGPVVLGLFTIGVAMSIVIPLLPFMIWCGGVMGWMIAVLEALVAAPIWMAGHLHPEGDDVTGKGIAGYIILVETIFRPVLMVFALVAAFLMIDIMLRFTGSLFFETFNLNQANSTTGIPTMICVCLLYVGLTWTLCKTSFGLIYGLPSKVWTWIGGAHSSHEKAESFAGDVEAIGRGAAASVGGASAKAGLAFSQTRKNRSAENSASRKRGGHPAMGGRDRDRDDE